MGKVISIIKKEEVPAAPDRFGHTARSIVACLLILVFAVVGVNGLMGLVWTHAVNIEPNCCEYCATTITVVQGSKIELSLPDEVPFHTFAGWFQDKEFKTPFNPTTETVKSSMTLYGKWTRNQYTITFVDPRFLGNETKGVIKEITDEFGADFFFPTPEGATEDNFYGWSVHMRGMEIEKSNDPSVLFQMPEQNVTFYAIWAFDFWAYERPLMPPAQSLTLRFNFQDSYAEVFYYDNSSAVLNQFAQKTIQSTQIIDLPTMLGVTALNDGYTQHSFGFWALTPGHASDFTADMPVFRDGQTVALGQWIDYTVNGVLEFFAVWI